MKINNIIKTHYLCKVLKEYNISEILSFVGEIPLLYYFGTFEETEDNLDLDWPHRHLFYSMVWFTKGHGFYVIDFEEYEIKPQRLFFVNPQQIHNWDYSENSKGYILMVDSALGTQLNCYLPIPFLDLSNSEFPFFENIFTSLIFEFSKGDSLSRENNRIGIQYLYSLLRRKIESLNLKKSVSDKHLEKFKYLIFNEKSIITVEEYASKLHISLDELNFICHKWIGKSAKQYILNLKITEAKRLLIFTHLNISEISYELGFDDSSYFARLFKKRTFFSPSDFLKKYRKL